MLLSSSSLYQARKHVHASTMSFFRRLRRSVMSNLADENTRSHSADINGIDNRSNAILDRWGNSCWRALYHSNRLSHGWTPYLQYSWPGRPPQRNQGGSAIRRIRKVHDINLHKKCYQGMYEYDLAVRTFFQNRWMSTYSDKNRRYCWVRKM